MIETIKQPFGSMICVACAAAMICGTTPEDFIAWSQDPVAEEGYTDTDVIGYCAQFGITLGTGFFFSTKAKVTAEGGIVLEWDTPLTGKEAYIVVQSMTNPDWTHAVYWDGNVVHDPSPAVDENRIPLDQYEIESLWLIQRPGIHRRPWMK